MEQKIIAIIPCKNHYFKNLESSSLINIIYKSLSKFDISKITFVIGFDDDDVFFINNKELLQKTLPSNFYLRYLNNFDKSYVCIINQLADIAINEYQADYIFVMADDLEFITMYFIDLFVDYLKDKKIGLGHCKDLTNAAGICTHPFVTANHVKYLGYFYPKEIKNWFCDDWITKLYNNLNLTCVTKDYVLKNVLICQRYIPYHLQGNMFQNLVSTAENILKEK